MVITIITCEVLLFLAEQFSPKYKGISEKNVVILPDQKLAHRPSPHYPEHDSRGFRNETLPSAIAGIGSKRPTAFSHVLGRTFEPHGSAGFSRMRLQFAKEVSTN